MERPRNVLMFYPSLLDPPDTGSKRRGMFVLEYLLDRFKTVHLCMPHDPADSSPACLQEITARGAIVHLIGAGGGVGQWIRGRLQRWTSLLCKGRMPSFESSGFLDAGLTKGFKQVVMNVSPDVLLITHTRFAGLIAAWPHPVFATLDTIDVQKELDNCYAGYRGIKAWLAPLLRGYRERGPAYRSEVEILKKYQRVIAISSGDREALLQAGLAQNSVFEVCEAFGATSSEPVAARTGKDTDLLVVASLFLGTIESIDFLLREVLPKCCRPLSLTVVGKICDYLASTPVEAPENVRMTLAGVVTDLTPYYERSRLVVIPVLRGTGVSIKCAEAFSRGAAVVTTRKGARGVAAVDGDNCLMADTSETIAEKINIALNDDVLRERLGRSAWAASRRSRIEAYETLDRLFAPILSREKERVPVQGSGPSGTPHGN